MPDAGNLNFWIQFRNFSQHPVHYQFEYIDIRLGTRAIQRVRTGNISGYMARGVGRTTIIKGFSKAELKEFYDGSSPAEGSVEFSLVYGPAERAARAQIQNGNRYIRLII